MLPTQEPPSTACPACSPSPLLGCLHNSSSTAPLGRFLPKSLPGIFGFFSFFLSLRPVPAHPVPMFLENRLHPSPQELFLTVRQWLCLSLSPTKPSHIFHTHPPHGSCHPSALFPMFGVPVPISSCPTGTSPFVSSPVPWAAGACGCPRPCTCLFNKTLSLLSAC